MPPMCSRTASAPSTRSPAVWFSNTTSSAWNEHRASRSWRFHAASYASISVRTSALTPESYGENAEGRPSAPFRSVTPGRGGLKPLGRGDLLQRLLGRDQHALGDRDEPQLRRVLRRLALGERPENHLPERRRVRRLRRKD